MTSPIFTNDFGGTKPLTGSPSSKGPSIGGLFGGVTSPIFTNDFSRRCAGKYPLTPRWEGRMALHIRRRELPGSTEPQSVLPAASQTRWVTSWGYSTAPCFVPRGNKKPNAGGHVTLIVELTAGTCARDDISKENLEPEAVTHATDQLLPR